MVLRTLVSLDLPFIENTSIRLLSIGPGPFWEVAKTQLPGGGGGVGLSASEVFLSRYKNVAKPCSIFGVNIVSMHYL